jgi:hypothetical protein
MVSPLHSGWAVDQARRSFAPPSKLTRPPPHAPPRRPAQAISEEERVVVIRFGHDDDRTCAEMDAALNQCADDVKAFAVIYTVREGYRTVCPVVVRATPRVNGHGFVCFNARPGH